MHARYTVVALYIKPVGSDISDDGAAGLLGRRQTTSTDAGRFTWSPHVHGSWIRQ